MKIIFFISIIFLLNYNLKANDIGQETGFNIPRFVSLKSNDVNLRIGSSINYPIILKYITKNYPVEIIDEYESWRKIRDIDSNEGWIHKSLIKGDRYGIILSKISTATILNKPDGRYIGEIGNRNIVKINICLNAWCKIEFKDNKGWLNKVDIWGVYSNEKINKPFYQPIINQIWKVNKYFKL